MIYRVCSVTSMMKNKWQLTIVVSFKMPGRDLRYPVFILLISGTWICEKTGGDCLAYAPIGSSGISVDVLCAVIISINLVDSIISLFNGWAFEG